MVLPSYGKNEKYVSKFSHLFGFCLVIRQNQTYQFGQFNYCKIKCKILEIKDFFVPPQRKIQKLQQSIKVYEKLLGSKL